MRKATLALALLLVSTTALAGGNLVRSHLDSGRPAMPSASDLQARLVQLYGAAATSTNVYVGSEFCIACHSDYAGWRDTKHNQALRRPMPEYALMPGKGIVADYDKNGVDDFTQGLDFNAIASAFDPYKPNAPKLSAESGRYFVTIGDLKMPVIFTQGGTGEWKQRYGVRIPVTDRPGGLSAEIYMTPIQYNEAPDTYVLYNIGNWYDASNQPKWKAGMTSTQVASHGGTYSKKCIGCHTTGLRGIGQTSTGEWLYNGWVAVLYNASDPSYFDYDGDGQAEIVNIGCEACHGPGGDHILSGGSPSKIVNPAKLSTEEANEVCGQCHIRVLSTPAGTHEWPFNDATKTPWVPGSGESLASYYKDAGGYWPDGKTSKQHHQQLEDLYRSTKPTFQFHPVRCTECHNSHNQTGNQAQLVEQIVDGSLTIPTRNNDNTLCLACHATHGPFESITKEEVAHYADNVEKIGSVISAHSHHPYGPDRMMGLSRCSTCHMPATAVTAVAYDIHSHTFEVVPPEKTLNYQANGGMPNACAVSCHGGLVNSFKLGLDPSMSTWNAQFDKDLASKLLLFYGPNGAWWQKTLSAKDLPVGVPAPPQTDD
ncbi:MAG: hypothetical protein AB1625_06755 [Acidobacteriota bacterium]